MQGFVPVGIGVTLRPGFAQEGFQVRLELSVAFPCRPFADGIAYSEFCRRGGSALARGGFALMLLLTAFCILLTAWANIANIANRIANRLSGSTALSHQVALILPAFFLGADFSVMGMVDDLPSPVAVLVQTHDAPTVMVRRPTAWVGLLKRVNADQNVLEREG